MSFRDSYRSSGDLGYGGRGSGGGGGGGLPRGGGPGGAERWDSERFAMERDRARFAGGDRERFEERESFRAGPGGRVRERSVDDIYERRGPRGRDLEEDRYESRQYYDDEPRYERERPLGRGRGGETIVKEREREREYYDPPSPPRRASVARPAFLRRQSSLDTFDRKPLTKYVERREEREEYGPPARWEGRREELRAPPLPPLTPIPLPRTRGLPPPRRYEDRDYYEDIQVAEPDFYGDEQFRGYPERVREREVIRRRRRSKESRASHSVRGSVRSSSVRGSVRSSSVSSSSSSASGTETVVSVRSEFPKKGKTRMPGRLVSKQAIIDLGYPFEEEGETIIIMKALGRENIDEVIKLSEDYKSAEKEPASVSGARSEAGTVVEERHEVFTVPAPPPPPPVAYMPPPPPPPPPAPVMEVVQDTKIVEHREPSPHHHHHEGPVIIDAGPREESTFIEKRREVYEQSDAMPVGPLALALPAERHSRHKDERAIRAEIKALEAEKEALRAEKRADREMRRAERLRRGGRSSESDLVLYDRGEEVTTLVRRERIEEPEGGVRIEKDRKAPPPRLIRAMLKTLT